jgi:hypothetical protein
MDIVERPTAEQFRETAKRLRTVIEYGLAGVTLGDNEVARAAMACEIAAGDTDEIERLQADNAAAALRRSQMDIVEPAMNGTLRMLRENIKVMHQTRALPTFVQVLFNLERAVEEIERLLAQLEKANDPTWSVTIPAPFEQAGERKQDNEPE